MWSRNGYFHECIFSSFIEAYLANNNFMFVAYNVKFWHVHTHCDFTVTFKLINKWITLHNDSFLVVRTISNVLGNSGTYDSIFTHLHCTALYIRCPVLTLSPLTETMNALITRSIIPFSPRVAPGNHCPTVCLDKLTFICCPYMRDQAVLVYFSLVQLSKITASFVSVSQKKGASFKRSQWSVIYFSIFPYPSL